MSIRLYRHQSIKEHILRYIRLLIGIGWFTGILSPITAGAALITDGLVSIFRYRFKNVTKDFIEDVPRLVRVLIGLSIVYAIYTPALI